MINFDPNAKENVTELASVEVPVANAAPKKNWVMIGGAVVLGVAGLSAALASGSKETKWADATPVASAQGPAAPAKLAMVTPANSEDAVRGVIQSQMESVVASRMTAKITSMPYRPGESFGRGAMLARFDCSIIQAQLSAAQAATAAYRKTYETNAELDAYQAVGKNEVAVSKANLGKANAEAGAVSAQLHDCAVYAPFAGTVVEQTAHANDVAASGQPLMKIQSNGALEVQLIVPSNWLTWVKAGVPFKFKIDETGAVVSGSVSRLGASVDPVSKTIRITGEIKREGDAPILPGMSGSATFDQRGSHGKPA